MRRTKQIVLLIIGSILTLLGIISSDQPPKVLVPEEELLGITTMGETQSNIVARVIDGDTLELISGEKVRLIGIDASETKEDQCYSLEAKLALEQAVLDRSIELEKDSSDTDRYDRLLRYIWIDGQMVNKILVETGYAKAKAYPPDTRYQLELETAQLRAQAQDKGLWSSCPQ